MGAAAAAARGGGRRRDGAPGGAPPPALPPGSIAWSAAAAPFSEPMPAREAALVQVRWLMAAGGGGDDHLRGGGGREDGRAGGRVPARAVSAVHKAKAAWSGLDAGGPGGDPAAAWSDARLWRYEDGGLGLLVLSGPDNVPELLLEWERVPAGHVS